jgi:hypothetical protein
MRIGSHTRRAVAALAGAAALALVAFAGVALAGVLIYSNTLSSNSAGKQLAHFEGNRSNCARHVRGGSLLIQATGKDLCGYRLPLEGDRRQPDHTLQARLKLDKQTPKKLRKKSYVGVAVRVGGGTGYYLRLLPSRHQFALRRLPHAKGFNRSGKTKKIKASKWNHVRLQAIGSTITAIVNGKKVASVDDSADTGVTGRKAEVFAGANKANSTGAFGRVDDVRLLVPSP